MASVIATLRSVFPSVTVFRPRNAEVDLLLVATPRPLKMDAQRLGHLLSDSNMRAELGRIQIHTLGDLLARHLADDRHIRRITKGAPLNTDDNARVEFSAPKDLINYRKHSHRRILAWLRTGAARVEDCVLGAPDDLLYGLADAYLHQGAFAEARAVLSKLPAQDPKAKRRREVMRGLMAKPPIAQALRHLSRTLSGDDPVLKALALSNVKRRRREILRIVTGRPPSSLTFRLLGVALADTRHHGLALLFLTAAAKTQNLSIPERWIRAKLLRKLSLHRLAFEQALATEAPRAQ